jgi:transcription-repair coupling factor (superfamily II helicase)
VLEVLMKQREGDDQRHKSLVIVTYPEALVPLVVAKEVMQKNTLAIKRNEELPIDTLQEWLEETGFTRVEFVYEPGQFSIRGGIVDVFSYGNDKPYRIELYGDTVESVRRFDPQDQLTVERLAEAVIVPDLQDEDAARQQLFFAQLPENATIWLRDLQAIGDAAKKQLKLLSETYERLPDKDHHAKPSELLATDTELIKGTLGFRKVFWAAGHLPLAAGPTTDGPEASSQRQVALSVDFQHRPQPTFAKEFKVLSGDLHNKQNAGYTNLIACNSAKQSERLYSIFNDMEHEVAFTPLVLDLHEGFIDPELKLALYTDHQIFERYHRYRLKEGFRRNAQALTLKELTQLKPGDLVVHIDHGVGVFSGLETIDAGGSMQEAIRLKYRDNDILYVGIHSLHRVSKYSGEESGKAPNISKLGSPAWKNLKEKTKAKVKALAFDLIKLYAQRKSKPGFAFQPDNYLQHELEASFIYEDTPDQQGHAGREARHGKTHADGSTGLRRCGFREDGSGDPRGVQSGVRRQASCGARAHHHPRVAALEELLGAHERPAGARGLHQPLPQQRGADADPQGPQGRQDRHHHRHAPAGEQGCAVQGPRPPDHRRGAEVRREREGQAEDPARHGGHAHPHRHADPAHAAVQPHGCARPQHHQHAAAQPLSGEHHAATVR